MKFIIATRNAHKTQEIAQILPSGFKIESLADYPYAPDAEENGSSFAENAAIKSLSISQVLDGLILADDSGLCVDALDGAPGIYSARYAGEHGNDSANNEHLLKQLRALPQSQQPFTAHFVCAMSLAQKGVEIARFEGKVEGHISLNPDGEAGFGYDPLFIPLGHTQSFACLPASLKNTISHRANALKLLADFLEKSL